MAFVKEFRSIREKLPEWDYLNSIGVRNMSGDPYPKFAPSIVLDRDRNYYLLQIGHQGLAYNDIELRWFLLCLNGNKVELEVGGGGCLDRSKEFLEYHWEIRKVEILDRPIMEIFNKKELKNIIIEAFTALSTINEDSIKKLGVIEIKITCDMEALND